MTVTLRRYTSLISALDILKNKRLTLLSPTTWDDANDAYFLEQYRRQKSFSGVLALCFAECAETYHHWRIFSPGSNGVCVQFKKNDLKRFLGEPGIIARNVRYEQLVQTDAANFLIDDLPFVKRYPFRDEREFRIIYGVSDPQEPLKWLNFDISCIDRITLSPWMPKPLVDTLRSVLKSLDGCSELTVYRTSLVDNENWRKLAAVASQQA